MPDNVQDIDMGWKRIKRAIFDIDGDYTKIGLQEGATHKDPENGDLSDLVTIGAVHEYGGRNHNAYAWLRSAYDKNLTKINLMKAKLYGKVLDGTLSVNQSLRLLGEFMESRVKANIRAIKSPPNSLATQRAKARKVRRGSVTEINNPLIDTAQMLQSVRHVEVFK